MKKLYIAECTGWSSLFKLRNFRKVTNVSTLMLSEFCIENSIKKIDFLKIDVEGSEYDIVLGDIDFFKIPIDEIAIEADEIPRDNKYNLNDLLNKLRHHEYNIKLLFSKGKNFPVIIRCKKHKQRGPWWKKM